MKTILIFLLGSTINFLAFLFLSYFSLPLAYPALQNYFIIKDHINQTAPKNKKRLIIMSASDGLYGIIGELIDQETKYFPINYSIFLETGLDLEFRINKLISSLQDGDTLLLPLNYNFYITKENNQYYSYFQNMLSWGDEHYFSNNPFLSFITLLKSPPSKIPSGLLYHLKNNIEKRELVFLKLQQWSQKTQAFSGDSIKSMDQYGGFRYQQGTLLKVTRTEKYINQNFKIEPYFLRHYKKLKKFCDQHDIKIIFTYPPSMKNPCFDLDNSQDFQRLLQFKQELAKQDIILAGNPKNFQFSIKDFYDTPSHLNTNGAIKYTKELIKMLNQL